MGPRRAARALSALDQLDRAIRVLTRRSVTPRERERFQRYLDLLLIWNRAQRLTGLRSPGAIVSGLFQDALLFLRHLPHGSVRVADVGAGAGVPGVPLAIVRPEISMVLIEARRKRVSFLSTLKRELQMDNVTVIEGRAEDVVEGSAEARGAFDVVVSRAVGRLDRLVPTAMLYLKAGGVFIASGPPPGQASATARAPGGVHVDVVRIPELDVERTFLLASKCEG